MACLATPAVPVLVVSWYLGVKSTGVIILGDKINKIIAIRVDASLNLTGLLIHQ